MKTILKRLWNNVIGLTVLLLTIASAIVGNPLMLWILILFIFRGIMWEAQYAEALNKYVTDPAFRQLLRLPIDGIKRKRAIIDIIFNIIFIVFVIIGALILILNPQV